MKKNWYNKVSLLLVVCLLFVSCGGGKNEDVVSNYSMDGRNVTHQGVEIVIGPESTIDIENMGLDQGVYIATPTTRSRGSDSRANESNNKNVFKTEKNGFLPIPDENGKASFSGKNIGISGNQTIKIKKFDNIDDDLEISRSESKYDNMFGLVDEYYYVSNSDIKGTVDWKKPIAIVRTGNFGISNQKFAIIETGFDPAYSEGLLNLTNANGFGLYMSDYLPQIGWGSYYGSKLNVVNPIELSSTPVTLLSDVAVMHVNKNDSGNYDIVVQLSEWNDAIALRLCYYTIATRYSDTGAHRIQMVPELDPDNKKITFHAGIVDQDFIFTVDLTDVQWDSSSNPMTFTLNKLADGSVVPEFVDLSLALKSDGKYEIKASGSRYTTIPVVFSENTIIKDNAIGAITVVLLNTESKEVLNGGFANFLPFEVSKGFSGYFIFDTYDYSNSKIIDKDKVLFTIEPTDNSYITGHSRLECDSTDFYNFKCVDNDCTYVFNPMYMEKYFRTSLFGNFVSEKTYGEYGHIIFQNCDQVYCDNAEINSILDIHSHGNAADPRYSSLAGATSKSGLEGYVHDFSFAIDAMNFDVNGFLTSLEGTVKYYDAVNKTMVTDDKAVLVYQHSHLWEREGEKLICSGKRKCNTAITNFVELQTETYGDIYVKITGLDEGDYISFYNATECRNEGDVPNTSFAENGFYTFARASAGLKIWLIPSASKYNISYTFDGINKYVITVRK